MPKIVNTDNFGSDYPAESFLNLPPLTQEHAEAVAKAINSGLWYVADLGEMPL